MDEPADEVVLDRMSTPGGDHELVAYRARGIVWIGYRPTGWPTQAKGSPAEGALGLHTGSEERSVEATASVFGTWGIAFGGVASEIERGAVRNDRGDLFPARILLLPRSFEQPYRAAWGIATGCRRSCELIGYDTSGRLITGQMIRRDHKPSPAESLELLRAHCDGGLRYLTWALKRMPSIPEQADHIREVQNSRHALALVLAYVEGATNERTALSATDEIVRRYEIAVEAEGWQPSFGTCSFCGDQPVVAWFEGPDFKTWVRAPDEVSSEEAWLACSTCLTLVEAGDRAGLVKRAYDRRWSGKEPPSEALADNRMQSIREQHERFWARRSKG